MTKNLIIASLFITALSFASCKRCHTCTYTNEDSSVTTNEVCDKGARMHSDAIQQYEKSGWVCTSSK